MEELKTSHKTAIETQQLEFNKRLEALETEWADKVEKKETEKLQEVNKLKEALKESNSKIEQLNKVIGRYESKEEFDGKGKEDKDREIVELKQQVKDLIESVKTIKEQTERENQEKVSALQEQVSEYKRSIEHLKQAHSEQINELVFKHNKELSSFEASKNTTNEASTQLASVKSLLAEKEALLVSTKQSYQSLVDAKSDTISTLNTEMIKLKLSKSEVEKELFKLQEENRALVERFKEEMQSVLSMKSSFSDEDTLASREEFNENIRIINDFFDNPYSRSLKKIFKLKRVRKEDKSVDSMNLMVKNHDFDSRSHEELRHVSNIEKVKEKDVNEGRVEDMAKPGPRPQPLRARGAPNAMRGRGAPIPRGRGGPGIPLPPRNEPRGNMQSVQSTTTPSVSQNIHIMDPNKLLRDEPSVESPADKLSSGITTPPRKRSFGITNSPKIHRSDPFKITNVNVKQEVEKKMEEQKKKDEDDEYEEVLIEEEEEEETENEENKESLLEDVPPKQGPPKPMKIQGSPKPAPTVTKQTPPLIKKQSSENPPNRSIRANPPVRSGPPPMMNARIQKTVPPRETRQPDRRRDPPPMKPRTNDAPETNKVPEFGKGDKNDDRSKTPQPAPSSNITPARVARFSRETDEPPVTHAVVRDKSITERLRSTLLPGFLGGGSTSTLAVTKAEQPVEQQKTQEDTSTENKSKAKPPIPVSKTKNSNAELLKQMRMKKYQQEKSKFEGYFNGILGFFIRKKGENQPIEFSDDEDDDIPPPPKIDKKEDNKDVKGDAKSKNRMANRYASIFDMNQLAEESEEVKNPFEDSQPKTKAAPFKPPPLEGTPFKPEPMEESKVEQPSVFRPAPEETDSPSAQPNSHTSEKNLEKVRQDVTSLPHYEEEINEGEDGLVKLNESENEEAQPEISRPSDLEPPEANVVTHENYEKAYNQLQAYKNENRALKKEIIKNQRTTEINIDYFVQLCEDVKYRGMDEIEQYKNEISILRREQKRFINKQAENLCLINKLETELKFMKNPQSPPSRPYRSPKEAKQHLKQGLEELKNLQLMLETLHSTKCQLSQKEALLSSITSTLLHHLDPVSPQYASVQSSPSMIPETLKEMLESHSSDLTSTKSQLEKNFAEELSRMHEDSKYKEERINELIKDGLLRARTEEEQTKEFIRLTKEKEEKEEIIRELELEIHNLKENHSKIEEQFQARFQEILDENQNQRDEWMRSGESNEREAEELKAEVDEIKRENDHLRRENEEFGESYRVMEAEFTKYEEDNKSLRHYVQVLEQEVSNRDEILAQYEQGDDAITQENQEKFKELIDKHLETEQQLDDIKSQYITVWDYLKDINNTIKNDESIWLDDDADKSMEFNANLMTEEEAEEVYENILNLYQNKVNDLTSRNEDLELQLQEIRMELDNKENELLDSQISGTQTASTEGDDQKKRLIRSLREKIEDLSDELKVKNNNIELMNKELQHKIDEISKLHEESEDLKFKLEEYESNDHNEDLIQENETLKTDYEKVYNQYLEERSKYNDLETEKDDEIHNLTLEISNKQHQIHDLAANISSLKKDLASKTEEISSLKSTISKSEESSMSSLESALAAQKSKYESSLQDALSKLSAQNDTVASLKEKLSSSESLSISLKDQLSSLQSSLSEKDSKISTLEESLKFNQSSINHLQSENNTLKDQLSSTQQEIEKQKIKMTAQNKENEKKFMKQTEEIVSKLKEKLNKQREKAKKSEELLKQAAEKLEATEGEHDGHRQEIERIRQEADAEVNVLNSKIQKLQTTIADRDKRDQERSKREEQLHNELMHLNREMEEIKGKYEESLKKVEATEGEMQGIKQREEREKNKVEEIEKALEQMKQKVQELED